MQRDVDSELIQESTAMNGVAEMRDLPLCVDLDGTLLRTDLFYESLLALLARKPVALFLLPVWLLRGKAALKREIASRVDLDVATLPYNDQLITELAASSRRKRILCTASDSTLADKVAAHIGLFDLVLASDGQRNLSGPRKAAALVEHFGERGFDYAGNAAIDLHVWRHARRAWVINASDSLAAAAAKGCPVETHSAPSNGGLKSWLHAIRMHQWLKNLLVLVALLASHRFFDAGAVASTLSAFMAFSLCASGVYVLNDLFDLAADRQHPRKRMRPFAAGDIPLVAGMFAAPALTVAGIAIALLVGPMFALVLLVYFATTLAYSLRLKRVAMLDVVVLAGLYTIRIIGGAVAIGSVLSFWLLAFSMFTFLSLAMVKRYTELGVLLANSRSEASGRGYNVEDLPLIQSLGAASGYIAVLVLALYINSPESLALYHRPQVLWLLCPLLLYWMSRFWVIAHRGEMNDDPVVFAALDRISQAVLLLCGVIAMVAI
jgi:4-hydroxybenzoate polyprenyltransferase